MQETEREQASDTTAPRLAALWFDGRSARAQPVTAWLSRDQLHLQHQGSRDANTDTLRSFPLQGVQWSERLRHGARQALLPDGSVLSEGEAGGWDEWTAAAGLGDPLAVRWMRSWRLVGLSLLLSVGLLAAAWRWGIPWAAERGAALLPAAAEQQIASQAMAYFDEHWLSPSRLPPEERAAIEQRLAAAVSSYEAQRRRGAETEVGAGVGAGVAMLPPYRLHFRAGKQALGPNAFALPGGDIVLTDALVELMRDRPDAITGVLAHELGHVRHRHGLRLALQASLVAGVAGVVVGDFSALIAGVPALLAQADYSREFEREADRHAREMMRAAGIAPSAMAEFFERLAAEREKMKEGRNAGSLLPIAFASHPADAERIEFFSAP